MAVEFWTRRQPVTSYPSKGKGRNNPFSFENFKTFVGGLSFTVAFAFGAREGIRARQTRLICPSTIQWSIGQVTNEVFLGVFSLIVQDVRHADHCIQLIDHGTRVGRPVLPKTDPLPRTEQQLAVADVH
jgi:hypothetical protein